MRTPSPSWCGLDRTHLWPTGSSLGDPLITARNFSSCPSDSISRWTPCPPETASGGFRSALARSEEHTSELQSLRHLVCRLLLEKKKQYPSLHSCRIPSYTRALKYLSRTAEGLRMASEHKLLFMFFFLKKTRLPLALPFSPPLPFFD